MLALGARLLLALRAGDVITLTGGLGAGKTTLTRGLIQAAHPDMIVPSPTYTLVQTYDLPGLTLWHCDLYRLEHPDEAFEIGLIDALEDDVCLIEWPDKLGGHMPETTLDIAIAFKGDGRVVTLTGWDGRDV